MPRFTLKMKVLTICLLEKPHKCVLKLSRTGLDFSKMIEFEGSHA